MSGPDSAVAVELQRIFEEHGELTAALVLQAATDPTNPLHSHFTWDDAEAANRHRLDQARRLIRSVRVVYAEGTTHSEPRSVRAWHSLPASSGKPTYQPAEAIAEDPFQRRLLLQNMRREWLALHRRYAGFEEFAEMVAGTMGDQSAAG